MFKTTTCLGMSLRKTNVSTLKRIGQSNCSVLDISRSSVADFHGMVPNPNLVSFTADYSKLASFRGAIPHDSIKDVSMIDTPLSREPHFELMVLIALAPRAVMINGQLVSDKLRSKANSLHASIVNFLRRGYLLVTLQPLRIVDVEFREEVILIDMPASDADAKEREIERNSAVIASLERRLHALQEP